MFTLYKLHGCGLDTSLEQNWILCLSGDDIFTNIGHIGPTSEVPLATVVPSSLRTCLRASPATCNTSPFPSRISSSLPKNRPIKTCYFWHRDGNSDVSGVKKKKKKEELNEVPWLNPAALSETSPEASSASLWCSPSVEANMYYNSWSGTSWSRHACSTWNVSLMHT